MYNLTVVFSSYTSYSSERDVLISYNRTQDKDNIEHTLTTVQADYGNIL
jgi:hypothetical protein